MKIYDAIIIGRGPAGISAALYTKRANLDTLIIGQDESALKRAGIIENYFGFDEPMSGEKLLNAGERQVTRLGVQIINKEVADITKIYEGNYFKVTAIPGEYYARSVLLATGQPHKKINIRGLNDYEGKGVSYCTTCDGFFYRGKSVGVLGFNDYAFHVAQELEAFTKDITILTNGAELELTKEFESNAGKYNIITRPLAGLSGEGFLEQIEFAGGDALKIDGVFVAYGTASSIDFAKKLGIDTEGNTVRTDNLQQTNMEGLFAAGDCTGGFNQVSTAVGQGALAGRSMITYVRKLNRKE